MINLTIDGQPISVPAGTTVYAAAKQLGIELPIFCYHDRMPPFGACRVCLVEVEKMAKPQTSCTLQVAEGMVVKTQSALAKEGRENILEFLLINHPLDCPICDKGGECPLQDQTLKFGPGMSRFFEEKRHFKKPIPLGPVLMLDRERCIVCARCTRFSDLVSGDHALEMKERGYKTEVGTPENSAIISKYIGNTIKICPVGALTSRAYRFRARPWDNKTTETTCTLCPVGCSMALDTRDGEVVRTRSVENKGINDIWLCDKGWFGYEFATHPDRLKVPLMRKNGQLTEVTWDEAFDAIKDKIEIAKKQPDKVGALGGNTLTIEENYLFQKWMREGIGTHHVDHRVGMPIIPISEEGLAPGMQLSLEACSELKVILLLGLDVTEEFPILWLRIKEAINQGAKVLFLGHYAPEVASHLSHVTTHTPGDELIELDRLLPDFIKEIERDEGKDGSAIFVGRQYLANHNRLSILDKLIKLQTSTPSLTINIMEGNGNSSGARFAGMHPELAPFNHHVQQKGYNALQLIEAASEFGLNYLHVAGANPAVKVAKELWKKARSKIDFLVVQDLFLTETAKEADIVLPTLCFLEKKGHFLTIAGDLQKLHPAKGVEEGLYSDGEIFKIIAERCNFELEFDMTFADKLFKKAKNIFNERPNDLVGRDRKKVELKEEALAVTFAKQLFDRGTRMCHNAHLRKLAKEAEVVIHPLEAFKRNLQSGDSVMVTFGKISQLATVRVDPVVATKTLIFPLGYSELNAFEISPTLLNGVAVTLVAGGKSEGSWEKGLC